MTAYAAAFNDPRPSVTVIGAGAMGRVLAARLRERGYPVLAVISRTRDRAEDLAHAVGARIASDSLHDLPAESRLIVCCIPDGKLAEVASRLSRISHPWRKTVVMHTSGALPASVLRPVAEEGARTLSFHPLQALTATSGPEALEGVYAGIEGEPPSLAAGIEFAVGLGMRYLILSADAKPRYHLAASIASNYLVTLNAVVQQIFQSLDIDRATAQEVMAPLVHGTLANLAASSPEEALTGPILRGDLETVHKHGLALRRHLPHLIPVYASLAMETITLAVRSSRLDPARAEEMLALLSKMVTMPLPVAHAVREEVGPRREPVRTES
jgi:predicted short-subunit dehydrogenase-like oxidoreductase (DUF2520 family)